MSTKREKDRRAAGQEAPMVVTPRMLVRAVRQIITSLRGIRRKASRR